MLTRTLVVDKNGSRTCSSLGANAVTQYKKKACTPVVLLRTTPKGKSIWPLKFDFLDAVRNRICPAENTRQKERHDHKRSTVFNVTTTKLWSVFLSLSNQLRANTTSAIFCTYFSGNALGVLLSLVNFVVFFDASLTRPTTNPSA